MDLAYETVDPYFTLARFILGSKTFSVINCVDNKKDKEKKTDRQDREKKTGSQSGQERHKRDAKDKGSAVIIEMT